jgi:hypothetical protein
LRVVQGAVQNVVVVVVRVGLFQQMYLLIRLLGTLLQLEQEALVLLETVTMQQTAQIQAVFLLRLLAAVVVLDITQQIKQLLVQAVQVVVAQEVKVAHRHQLVVLELQAKEILAEVLHLVLQTVLAVGVLERLEHQLQVEQVALAV